MYPTSLLSTSIDLAKIPAGQQSSSRNSRTNDRFWRSKKDFDIMLSMLSLNIIVGLLFVGVVKSAAPLPESEYLALYDLYNATNGAEWVWKDNSNPWVFSANANPCTGGWQGVNCITKNSVYHVGTLKLSAMNLRGSMTSTIGNLTLLEDLHLNNNQLTGTIPSSIGSLVKLKSLYLRANQLNGTIPNTIGNLLKLHDLYLNDNQLTGTIPASIGNFTKLEYLSLRKNFLTGTIPSTITNLLNLYDYYLDNNLLNGTIPSSIGGLPALNSMTFEHNRLTGTIPATIGDLAKLHYLSVNDNHLNGTIPSSIGNLVKLENLYLNHNFLTGSIPSSLGNLVKMIFLSLRNNQLNSSIPSSLGNLVVATDFYLNNNQLSGTIPSSIGNLTAVQYLSLRHNQLTGSIPSSVGNLLQMVAFYADNNYLTGTLPDALGNCLSLQAIDLGENALTGTVPPSYANFKALLSISIQGNQLHGPIAGIFTDAQIALLAVRLDDNQFTGELPSVLFALPSLRSFSMVGSCLHGTLPGNICNATKLEALILYGLTTGSSCRAKGVQSLSQPLTHTQHTFGGAFPSCLLGLPDLTTLLLSSNRLTGSISSSTVVGGNLTELDLSHNALEGNIPNSLQSRSWSLFDLSHNKFTGVLQSDMFIQSNSSLQLESDASPVITLSSNRLSGSVPSSLRPLQSNLSVLAGNLFECKYDKSNLPQHDSDISNYECASNGFDIAIYVWLGMGASALAVLLLAYRHLLAQLLTSFIQLPDELSSRLTHLFALLEEFHSLQKAGWLCAAFCMCVLLPYYVTMSHYEGTHTYQYAYVLSAIYTSGVLSFVLDTLLLGLLVVGVYFGGQVFMRGKFVTRRLTVYQVTWKRAFVWGAFALINTTVVLGANVAFVYVVLYQSSKWQTPVQILLSLFKLGWGMVVSPALLRRLKMTFNVTEDANESYFTLQLLVALFNNIAIPCLVVAAIDTNCFSNILLPPNSETVEYSLPICNDSNFDGHVCKDISHKPATLQFTPPFTYSYQCSASLITSYAPTFIYMSISTVFLSPLLQYVLLRLHERLPAGSIAHRLVSKVLPRILKPPNAEDSQEVVDSSKAPILGSVDSLVALLTQLGILLTFGAIFPPVALAMAVSITAVVVVYRYKVQRFVRAVAEKQLFAYLDIINAECEKVGTREQMQVAAKILICYCCAFYTLFLFDTLGDAVGFEASVWVLIVVPLVPVAVFGCAYVHRRYQLHLQRTEDRAQGSSDDPTTMELSAPPPVTATATELYYWEGKEATGAPGRSAVGECVAAEVHVENSVETGSTLNALHASNV